MPAKKYIKKTKTKKTKSKKPAKRKKPTKRKMPAKRKKPIKRKKPAKKQKVGPIKGEARKVVRGGLVTYAAKSGIRVGEHLAKKIVSARFNK